MEIVSTKSSVLFDLIKGRRTVYPYAYSEKEIEYSILEKIMEAATWAPNHGMTEPWRFRVFKNDERSTLANFLFSTYKSLIKGDDFNEKKAEKLKIWPLKSAAIIAVAMKKGENPKIPLIEEERAVAAAIQNMLLMAYSYGIGSYWSTGKVVYSNEMKSYLGIDKDDQLIGLIYFGYPRDEIQSKKRSSINDKML